MMQLSKPHEIWRNGSRRLACQRIQLRGGQPGDRGDRRGDSGRSVKMRQSLAAPDGSDRLIGPECFILNQTIILNHPARETAGYTISEVAAYSSCPLTGG